MHKVSIVIPFYNGDEYIYECLESLSVGSYASAEKIVVNNSDRPTQIRNIAASFNNVEVLDTAPRTGFGRACNAGAKAAIRRGAQFIIILNQDSIAHKDLVAELLSPFEESPEVAVTAPIIYDNKFSSIGSYFISRYLSTCPELFHDSLNCQTKASYKIYDITGACFAIRADFVNHFGLFDPVYFMYWEDDDLCRKIKYLKYDIAIVPKAKIGHHDQVKLGFEDKKKKIRVMLRHSWMIFKLKDISVSFPKALLKICLTRTKEYLGHLVSLDIRSIPNLIAADIRLIGCIPRIIQSRIAEKNLVKKRTQMS